eukprot:Seg1572.4 transcript_id=Seg1572.4/GoldUCD/mRNA.D3Y31 product="BTB/POZ domain-containing protein 2" protein_id=Seg1572.4/GoldUCD/D3Y31
MAQKCGNKKDWQESKTTVKERIGHLLKNDFMSDFVFISNDVKFPVHKLILASTSAVFHAMFCGPMAGQERELDLSHYGNADCISEFLGFIYTDEVSLNWENVFQILNLAKCYLISCLQAKCTKFIEESVTEENALVALQQSLAFDENAAIKKSMEIIAENTFDVVKQDSFLSLNLASLKAILMLDTLNIEEIDLFLAVNKWCENQLIKEGNEICAESKRKVLGDAVYLIRFPTIALKDIAKDCSKSGILTHEQVIDVIHYISLESKEPQDRIVDKICFSTKPRNKIRQEIIADRILPNTKYFMRCYDRSWREVIEFIINRKAILTGLFLFGDPKSHEISQITITTNSSIFTPNFTLGEPSSGPVTDSFRVSLLQPIQLLPNQNVNLSAFITGPDSSGFQDPGKELFKKNDFECRFTSGRQHVGNTVYGWQYPGLIFEV